MGYILSFFLLKLIFKKHVCKSYELSPKGKQKVAFGAGCA